MLEQRELHPPFCLEKIKGEEGKKVIWNLEAKLGLSLEFSLEICRMRNANLSYAR